MRVIDDILHSFYSRRFYYDFAHERKGLGIEYVAVLTLLFTVFLPVYAWQAYPAMHPLIAALPKIAGSMPAITFQGNKVTIDKPTPFQISVGNGADIEWMMFDPHYVIADTDSLAKALRQSHVVLLMTADRLMVMKDMQGTLEMEDLSRYPDFSLSHEGWQVLGNAIASHGLTLYTLAFILITFVLALFYNVLATAVTGCVVLVLSWLLRARINLSAALRLAALLRIPAITVVAVPGLLGNPLGMGYAWLLWCGYLVFAVYSSREQIHVVH